MNSLWEHSIVCILSFSPACFKTFSSLIFRSRKNSCCWTSSEFCFVWAPKKKMGDDRRQMKRGWGESRVTGLPDLWHRSASAGWFQTQLPPQLQEVLYGDRSWNTETSVFMQVNMEVTLIQFQEALTNSTIRGENDILVWYYSASTASI